MALKPKISGFIVFYRYIGCSFKPYFIAKLPMHLIEYFLRHFCTRFDSYQQTCGSITRNVKSSIHASYFIYFSIKLYLPTTLQNKINLYRKRKHTRMSVFSFGNRHLHILPNRVLVTIRHFCLP